MSVFKQSAPGNAFSKCSLAKTSPTRPFGELCVMMLGTLKTLFMHRLAGPFPHGAAYIYQDTPRLG